MELKPVTPTAKAPAANFTGDVYVNPIYRGEDPSRMIVSLVRFAPGARTSWHSHAVGQTLHVTDGIGLVVSRDGTVIRMRPGDTVYTRPERNTGTAPPTATSCATWPCSKAPATATAPPGSNPSPTPSTKPLMSASRGRPLRPREEPQPMSAQIPTITLNNGVQMPALTGGASGGSTGGRHGDGVGRAAH